MHLRYVFSELRSGLRRNLSMHLAVILTLLVSLTLAGLGVLLKQQADLTSKYLGNQLEITVFLCNDNDPNPRCSGEVTDAQMTALEKVVDDSPEVASYRVESKQQAFEKVKELFGADRFEGDDAPVTVDAMQQSVWITLKDPQEYEGIESAVVGLDGVSKVRDLRSVLEPIYGTLDVMSYGSWVVAGLLVLAALLLVGNTIRLAALARRREIGIMRLVGASSLYITLPFLMEALVTAVIGVLLAAGALTAFWYFGVDETLAERMKFTSWIGPDELIYAIVVIAIMGPILTLLPTLVLTRKYLKV